MKNAFFFCFLALIPPGISCQGQSGGRSHVLLVSFDGFRSDYVDRFDLPNFERFIREGAVSSALIPCYPSKTFPNHYSIVTGLYPGNHGLVDNHFYDPRTRQFYSMRDRDAVTDPSFYGGVPLWQLARKNGIRTASFFWVGSEISDANLRPDYYYRYDASIPYDDRVGQVIKWLKLPEEERPGLITLYFASPDSEAHRKGPFGEDIEQKLLELDTLLGTLMQGIRETHLRVNVILVSDHGLSELVQAEDTYVFLNDLLPDRDGLTVVNGGTQAHVYARSAETIDSLYAVLSSREGDFSLWTRARFPRYWHYANPRAGDIIIQANPGRIIVSGSREKFLAGIEPGEKFGVHGYDPCEVPDMGGVFYANGPDIKAGTKIPAFENIHIYPFIAEMLGMKYGKIDGDIRVLRPVLKR